MWRPHQLRIRRKIVLPRLFSTSSSPSAAPHRYFFDQELAKLLKVQENKFLFPLSNQWSITTIPNGGFLSALAVKASRLVIHHGHVISLSSHFYNRTIENCDAEVDIEILSTTKSSSTVMATISQENKKRCSFLLTFSFKKSNKFTHISDSAPALPPINECVSASEKLRAYAGDILRIAQRVEFRVPADSTYMEDVATGGNPKAKSPILTCWLRYSDDRPITLTSLAFLNDCLPPPVLALVGFQNNWVPTVEYSVQFWGTPSHHYHQVQHHGHFQIQHDNSHQSVTGIANRSEFVENPDSHEQLLRGQGANPWVRAQFQSLHVENGTLSTDSQIWSHDGVTLLANARQLAKLVTVP
jgi:hypothetical protein